MCFYILGGGGTHPTLGRQREAGESKSAWYTEQVVEQPRVHREPQSQYFFSNEFVRSICFPQGVGEMVQHTHISHVTTAHNSSSRPSAS